MKRIYLQKAKTQVARPNTIRGINKQIVLNYIRDCSPISRADIARQTALQRSTVSAIADELQIAGLIEETGVGDSTGGRKPTLLRLKADTPIAIGIDITPRLTTIALANLKAEILDRETFPTSPDTKELTKQIVEKISDIKKSNENSELEIGISVPGITDQSAGTVIYSPYFQWRNWKLGKEIEEQTKLPVTIDNDANAIALAELWFGKEDIRKIRNFVTVLVAEGIGTGIVFDGQVYRGDKGSAGEFGHMIVGGKAPAKCSCGSYECWEAHASDNATIARYKLMNNSSNGNDLSMEELILRAEKGDEKAIKSIKETAKYLGIGISNLLVGLSPQAVIVSGKLTKVWNLVAEDLDSLMLRSVRGELSEISLIDSSLGEYPTIIGSLSLVLARKFASAI